MKNNAKIFAPLLLAVLIGSLTLIFAQTGDQTGKQFPGGEGKGFRPLPFGAPTVGGVPPHALDQLSLTDAQKQQIQALQETARTGARENLDKIKAFDDQLRVMLDAGTFDEALARQILNSKAQALTELEIARLKTEFAVKNVLTSEQKTQLEQLRLQPRPEFSRGKRAMNAAPPQN